MNRYWLKIMAAAGGLLVLYAGGLALRRTVLEAQYERYGRPLWFHLESALEFRYVRMLAEDGRIPRHDADVQAPDGLAPRSAYTLGAEYVYAAVAKRLPGALPLEDRVRWVSAAWFCLGIPLMALWLWWWTGSTWAAGLAGAYYAVSLASVMRSTGQELQHENFALPLLIAHFAFQALAGRAAAREGPDRPPGVRFWGASGLSALLLACAVCTWDLIQFYVLFWAAIGAVRFVAGRHFQDARARLSWGLTLLALTAVGWLNPYLRAHAFAGSFALWLAYGVMLGLGLERLAAHGPAAAARPVRHPAVFRLLLLAAALAAGVLCGGAYGETYGHFLSLLWAKVRFLNRKPADPALLTFEQRILWTAPLQSATWRLTRFLFPVTLPLGVWAGCLAALRVRRHPDPELNQLLAFLVIALMAFGFFARFHVFAVIGLAALLGWMGAWAMARRSALRWLAAVALLAGVGAEAAHVLRSPERWGSVPAYAAEKRALCDWLKAQAPGERVLANFGLSGTVLAYAGCPIVLHPKFESPVIRRRVREYGEALFTADEAGFRDWMEPYGAPFYVYALGEFAKSQPESQMRYCVNALDPPPSAAARAFEFAPERCRYFRLLWGNRKYRVFRVVTRADEREAARLAEAAARAAREGRALEAESKASQALLYDPQNTQAMQVLLPAAGRRADPDSE